MTRTTTNPDGQTQGDIDIAEELRGLAQAQAASLREARAPRHVQGLVPPAHPPKSTDPTPRVLAHLGHAIVGQARSLFTGAHSHDGGATVHSHPFLATGSSPDEMGAHAHCPTCGADRALGVSGEGPSDAAAATNAADTVAAGAVRDAGAALTEARTGLSTLDHLRAANAALARLIR